MDIVYLLRHSQRNDEEIRYSMRSVARNMPFIRKIWIFGDRPAFLSNNTQIVEHVSWEAVAWLVHAKTPVKNFFLQCFLASMHPQVDFEFLLFCDDYFILRPISEAMAKKDRYVENLDDMKGRGPGLWREQLWRTYDWLKRLGYPGYNFETHTPYYLTKKRVFEAYRELSDFVSETQFLGFTGPTGILNHAYKQERFPITRRSEENLYAGFHEKPAVYDDVVQKCKDRLFLNFDDAAFSDDMLRFLHEQFPRPCVFEAPGQEVSKAVPKAPAPAPSPDLIGGLMRPLATPQAPALSMN
jgi:hypothetical protein